MGFKDQVIADIAQTFHHTGEFADEVHIVYNGREYEGIPAVIDAEFAQGRGASDDNGRRRADHAQGIIACDVTMYISLSDMGRAPIRGNNIEVNEEIYRITRADVEAGEIILQLERLDEE